MKIGELRRLSESELKAKVASLEENLFRLRCNKTIGQLQDTSTIRKARRDIARAKTALNESRQSGA